MRLKNCYTTFLLQKKIPGVDGIHLAMLKECAEHLVRLPENTVPIYLTPISPKCMQSLVERHILEKMLKLHPLNGNQCGDQRGKYIELMMEMVVFVDVKGAFDCVFDFQETLRCW